MSTKKRKTDNVIMIFSLFNAIICFFSPENIANMRQ